MRAREAVAWMIAGGLACALVYVLAYIARLLRDMFRGW